MPGMNESAARDVLLVRALETTAASRELISDTDRLHAGRAAAELARWQSSAAGEPPSADVFLARRAQLLLEKLGATQPALARASQALAWRPALGIAVVAVAPLVGAVAEQATDRGHVNILAFPLLAIVGWNLVVYLVIAVQGLRRLARSAGAGGEPRDGTDLADPGAGTAVHGTLRGAIAALAQRSVGTAAWHGPIAPALRRFSADWSQAMAPLATARVARWLHLAAALFALGAILGWYARGLVFDYRIGWESTFLGPAAVHALLSTLLAPAAALLGIAVPDVAGIAALRFPASAGGARAADWIHLHAMTVLLAVVLPRTVLFAVAGVRERQLAQHLPLDLRAPYFRRLLAPLRRGDAQLRVVPFSYTLDETATLGLRAVAQRLLGEGTALALAPTVAYGDESAAATGLAVADPQVPMTLALCSLAATPEAENHGAFLGTLAQALGSAPLALLVDEGPYRRRLGTAVDTGAATRLEERRQAWQAFAAARSIAIACVDLRSPDLTSLDLEALERQLEPMLAVAADARRGALQ